MVLLSLLSAIQLDTGGVPGMKKGAAEDRNPLI